MKYLRVILIVLLLVCCTLWVASYWEITWVSSDGLLALQLWDGSFAIQIYEYDARFPYDLLGLHIEGYTGLDTFWWPVIWIYSYPGWWSIRCTFWLPTLLLALLVAIYESPWARRRRRAKQGLCIRCGYDLSGTDHDVCPECGTKREPIASAKKDLP